MPRKVPYREGDWFLVPLESSGFGLGRVARMNGRGCVLGYFFGKKYTEWPDERVLSALRPYQAHWVAQFGDLNILEGAWPVQASSSWDRTEWPIPQFVRRRQKHGELVRFTDDLQELPTRRCSLEAADKYPRDGLFGAGAVEVVLGRIVEKELTPFIQEDVEGARAFLRTLKPRRR